LMRNDSITTKKMVFILKVNNLVFFLGFLITFLCRVLRFFSVLGVGPLMLRPQPVYYRKPIPY
jgi:hypothetical protein